MGAEKPRILGPQEVNLSMSAPERAKCSVLIVDPNSMERQSLRAAAHSLGFGGISDVASHMAAFEKMDQRKFTHVLFCAKETNMPIREFLGKILEIDSTTVAIAASSDPNIDDVFDLLVIGAKGYLVKPFTAESVEGAIVMATKGEPIAEAVLQAKDRNEALIALLMASLDKAATIMRQSQKFETAKREVPKMMAGVKRVSDLAKTFSKGGEPALIIALEKFCIERSKGPATRLGRLRKRLRTTRTTDEEEQTEDKTDEASS